MDVSTHVFLVLAPQLIADPINVSHIEPTNMDAVGMFLRECIKYANCAQTIRASIRSFSVERSKVRDPYLIAGKGLFQSPLITLKLACCSGRVDSLYFNTNDSPLWMFRVNAEVYPAASPYILLSTESLSPTQEVLLASKSRRITTCSW